MLYYYCISFSEENPGLGSNLASLKCICCSLLASQIHKQSKSTSQQNMTNV